MDNIRVPTLERLLSFSFQSTCLILLLFLMFLSSVSKKLLISTYNLIMAGKPSTLAMFFLFHVLVIFLILLGSSKPPAEEFDGSFSFPSLEYGDEVMHGCDEDNGNDLGAEEEDGEEDDCRDSDMVRRFEESMAKVLNNTWREEPPAKEFSSPSLEYGSNDSKNREKYHVNEISVEKDGDHNDEGEVGDEENHGCDEESDDDDIGAEEEEDSKDDDRMGRDWQRIFDVFIAKQNNKWREEALTESYREHSPCYLRNITNLMFMHG